MTSGLLEDATAEGVLVTYPSTSDEVGDAGVRFTPADESSFACPSCGIKVKAVIPPVLCVFRGCCFALSDSIDRPRAPMLLYLSYLATSPMPSPMPYRPPYVLDDILGNGRTLSIRQ